MCEKHPRLYPAKTMSFSLNDGQADDLISYILDTHGPALNTVGFSDAACLALEDVSGFETPDAKDLALLRTELWKLYQSRTLERHERHPSLDISDQSAISAAEAMPGSGQGKTKHQTHA